MSNEQYSLLKASEINSMDAFEFHHPLNPNSEVYLRFLGRAVGLKRIGVTIACIPPGKESFIYHAHQNEEEWVYILSGQGIAEIGDMEYEVEPGDFMGFGLPQQPHHLRNPFSEELVYLMGGEAGRLDVGVFPRLGKRVIRDNESAYIVDESALQLFDGSK
ncbi:cupin domain-containing protein [Nodosilinea sp. LEGE 07088]|uniref:cupin domain-containing protein n=1 Tax=Nodosilinea sp. LEGE 07088 TaxID=2777968 RepID=UPI00188215B3|nr:cupin domain-containing protein [Nodosilinea sp. LEGE 07088]MBE9139192.1 cupin domain-containing protein [Nodosilinea sp. LEGE 07088]